jgi:hypothetical protein
MHLAAVAKAKVRLRGATEALGSLRNHSDQAAFGIYWYSFLTAWKGVYTVLEQGAKPFPQSGKWYGDKRKELRSEPLLEYLYEARNDEEHGLGFSSAHGLGSKVWGIPEGAKDKLIAFRAADGSPLLGQLLTRDQLSFEPGTGKPLIHLAPEERVTLVKEVGPGPTLLPVRGKHRVYGPCYALFGQPVEMSPIGVASAGLSYLEGLIAEAEALSTAGTATDAQTRHGAERRPRKAEKVRPIRENRQVGAHGPKEMFQAAEIHRLASEAIAYVRPRGPFFGNSQFVLAALSLEIFLKCLVVLEGNTYKGIHDLHCLFSAIADDTKDKLRLYYNEYIPARQAMVNSVHAAAGFPGVPPLVSMDFDLQCSKNAFEKIRYSYERRLDDWEGWVAYEVLICVRRAILDLKPEWANLKYGWVQGCAPYP